MPTASIALAEPSLHLLRGEAIAHLNGEWGINRADPSHCKIRANNDYEAIQHWLYEYHDKATTHRNYQKEAERLLLWCIYQHKKPLSSLDKEDFNAYFVFLDDPKPTDFWCGQPGGHHAHRGSPKWKPFTKGLSAAAKQTAITIIHSLMEFLVRAGYLQFNPLTIMRIQRKKRAAFAQRSLQIHARILEPDEWVAMIRTLEERPESSFKVQREKYRLRFIIQMLFYLGLRVSELETHRWNAFRKEQDAWWFFVVGKGDKPGKIPVNDELLVAIKDYRLFLGYPEWPRADEARPIIAAWRGSKAVSSSHINKMLKELAIETATKYFPESPEKQVKLGKFSAHWLRHLSASMQDLAGMSPTNIQANLRHERGETTRHYIHAQDVKRHAEMNKLRLIPTDTPTEAKPMIENNDGHFPPLAMLPTLAAAIEGALDASREQLLNFQQAQKKPYVLDDEIVSRVINSYTEQNETIVYEKKLCTHWQQNALTSAQNKKIEEMCAHLIEMEKINQTILALAKKIKEHTIDKIVNREEGELALAYLTGEMPSPLNISASTTKKPFKLPENVSYHREMMANNGVVYTFRHQVWGELGRIEVIPRGHQTQINSYIAASDPRDPLAVSRQTLFQTIADGFTQTLEKQFGAGDPNSKVTPIQPKPTSKLIESKLMVCLTCDTPVAFLIFAHDAYTPDQLEDYARMMYTKTLEVNLPTWVIGAEEEIVPGKEAMALILKTWPERKKAEKISSLVFEPMLHELQSTHCC